MTKLVLIDAMAILHRAYHAMPPLNTTSGEPINAVHGFVSMLLRIVNDLKPTHIAVAFDRPEPTFRKKAFENYQSQRPDTDKGLVSQFEKAKDVLTAMNILIFEKAGYEADDLLGSITKQVHKTKDKEHSIDETIIVTGDRDILQLVDDSKNIKLYMPVKGLSDAKLFGEAETIERLGIPPKLIPDYKGLVGDPSDNYKGVPGIGPKTAISLLNQYGGFENVYRNLDRVSDRDREKLSTGRESGEMSFKLAKIDTEVPIEADFEKMTGWKLGSDVAISLFKSYGFKTLTERIKNFNRGKGDEDGVKTHERPSNSLRTIFKTKLTEEEIEEVVVKIADKLKGRQYAIRGTASMVLQGLDMGVDDIDMIADKKTALEINKIFKKEIIKKVEFSESDKFKSYFGQFVIPLADSSNSGQVVLVEVMGEWQISNKRSWGGMQDANKDQVTEIKIKNTKIPVTKLDLELKTAADMGRWNEFHKIKKLLAAKTQQSLF